MAQTTAGASTGIPSSNVSAVVIDVTAKDSSPTNVYAYATDDTSPLAVLSLDGGDVKDSNTVIVKVGSDRKFNLKVSAGSAEANVDIQGYFTATSSDGTAGGFVPVDPTRVMDSTTGTGIAKTPVTGGTVNSVQVGGTAGIPSNATAVFANVRVSGATSAGGLRAGSDASTVGSGRPITDYGDNRPYDSGATLDLNSAGKLYFSISGGTNADVIIDVQGYFTAGSGGAAFHPLGNDRVWDSRQSSDGALTPGETRVVQVGGLAGVPEDVGYGSVAMTISALNGTSSGELAVTSGLEDTSANPASNLSWTAGTTVPANTTSIVMTDDYGRVSVHNASSGSVDVLINAQGWFDAVEETPVDDVPAGDTSIDDMSGPTPIAQSIIAAPSGGTATLHFDLPVTGDFTLAATTDAKVSLSKSNTLTGSYTATAIDADGTALAASLTPSGSTITETVTTTAKTSYPVTVTPVFTAADPDNPVTQSLYPDPDHLPMGDPDTTSADQPTKSDIVASIDAANSDEVTELTTPGSTLNSDPDPSLTADDPTDNDSEPRAQTTSSKTKIKSNVAYTESGSSSHWVPVPKWIINDTKITPKYYRYAPHGKHAGWHDYCTWSKDTWKRVTLRGPCAQHDMCLQYRQAPERYHCDNQLKWAIKAQCYHFYYKASDRYFNAILGTTGIWRRYDNYAICLNIAQHYYLGVHLATLNIYGRWGNSNPQTWPTYSYKVW